MKINISIDDVSPHPMSSVKVIDRCYEILKKFPQAKFSLFVPISYWRTIKPGVATQHPLQIDLFPEFCESIKNLPPESFEVCYHGFYHGIPGKSDNDEFQHLSFDEASERFKAMFLVVKRAGLEKVFKPIFRPPAWRMSGQSIEAASALGIKILALSPKEYAKETYQGAEESFEKVVYYTCNPPFDEIKRFEKNEIVYHACEWDRNFLGKDATADLCTWLSEQKDNHFCFLGEM